MAITSKLEMAGQVGVLSWGCGDLGDVLPGLPVDPTCNFKITVWTWLCRRQSENPERIASDGIKLNFKHITPASRHLPDGIYRLSGVGTGRGFWLLADRKSRTRQPSVSSTKGLKQNSDE
jgi:hypothetical protein